MRVRFRLGLLVLLVAGALLGCAAAAGHSVCVAETDAGDPFVVLARHSEAGAIDR